MSWAGIDKAGIQRLIGYDEVHVTNGKLSSMFFAHDMSGQQTAAFIKAQAAATTAKQQ